MLYFVNTQYKIQVLPTQGTRLRATAITSLLRFTFNKLQSVKASMLYDSSVFWQSVLDWGLGFEYVSVSIIVFYSRLYKDIRVIYLLNVLTKYSVELLRAVGENYDKFK